MDIADMAQDQIEKSLEFALKARKRSGLTPVGACHYCAEELRSGLLFCGPDCRDDYEHEQDIRARTGT